MASVLLQQQSGQHVSVIKSTRAQHAARDARMSTGLCAQAEEPAGATVVTPTAGITACGGLICVRIC